MFSQPVSDNAYHYGIHKMLLYAFHLKDYVAIKVSPHKLRPLTCILPEIQCINFIK